MIKMENRIWALYRSAFSWLDDTSVVVTSSTSDWSKGHCIILNTVRPLLLCSHSILFLKETSQSRKIDVDKTFVVSVARL